MILAGYLVAALVILEAFLFGIAFLVRLFGRTAL